LLNKLALKGDAAAAASSLCAVCNSAIAIAISSVANANITFASLEGISDYEEEGPEVVIPRAIAGGASEIWSWVESIF
jgi:hypothetical protein